MVEPLEVTAAEIDNLFKGLKNEELSPQIVNDVFKRVHPNAEFLRYEIDESKAISLGAVSICRIKYEVFTDNQSRGKFECLFNCAYTGDDPKDYILEVEDVRELSGVC
ncbi:MAG: hypothetical protein AABX17_00345 [Nanoarchaeota archaeon]